jgi:hypothetical protein
MRNMAGDWQTSTYVILRFSQTAPPVAFDRLLFDALWEPSLRHHSCHLRRRHNIRIVPTDWFAGLNRILTKRSLDLLIATTITMSKSFLLLAALASSASAFTFLTPSLSRATTARYADAYSYTYGGAPPPPQGGNAGGTRTDESRVVRSS